MNISLGKISTTMIRYKEEVMTWFKLQAADFYNSGIQKLVTRFNKCLDSDGEYFGK
jgi:hypothetical protein